MLSTQIGSGSLGSPGKTFPHPLPLKKLSADHAQDLTWTLLNKEAEGLPLSSSHLLYHLTVYKCRPDLTQRFCLTQRSLVATTLSCEPGRP